MRSRPLYDIVALLARIGIGTVFIAHGWQKVQVGVTTTSDQFTAWDVPFPTAAAVYATFVELLGGAALILGLALPVAGVLLFIDMAGAAFFVNGTNGIFLVDERGVVAKNGFELALVLGVAALVFATGGAGRLTLDSRLFGRRRATGSAASPRTPATAGTAAAASGAQDTAADGGRGERRAIDSRAESPSAASATSISAPSASASSSSSSRSPSSSSGEATKTRRTPSGAATTPGKPAMPATTGGPTVAESAASPRPAAEIVTGTSGDTLVAGRKKRRSGGGKDRRDETQPIPKRRGSSKNDSAD